jgi:hypothetical protein
MIRADEASEITGSPRDDVDYRERVRRVVEPMMTSTLFSLMSSC